MPRPNTDGGFLLPFEIDPPRRCVQLHIPDDPQHIRAFWGTLLDLARWFSWQRDDDHTGTAAARVWKEVLDEAWTLFESDDPCPCEEPTMTDCCEPILAALNKIIGLLGSNWRPDPILMQQQRQEVFVTINTPGFTPTDLDADAPDVTYTQGAGDEGGDDAIRVQALCHALWLLYLAAVHNAGIEFTWSVITASADALLAGSYVLSLLAWVGAGVVGTLGNAVLSDETAVRNLLCCMAEQLVDAAVTRENMVSAAESCQIGGNETLIGALLAQYMTDDSNWGAFILDMARAFRLIKHGADLYCPCDDDAGETCTSGSTFVNFEYTYDGNADWVPDSIGPACPGFGHELETGGTLTIQTNRCLNFVQLNRFFGGTSSGEATLARFTINGHVRYVAIESGQHCTLQYDPPQLLGPANPLRIDLLGGGNKMCYTGLITKQAIPD